MGNETYQRKQGGKKVGQKLDYVTSSFVAFFSYVQEKMFKRSRICNRKRRREEIQGACFFVRTIDFSYAILFIHYCN